MLHGHLHRAQQAAKTELSVHACSFFFIFQPYTKLSIPLCDHSNQQGIVVPSTLKQARGSQPLT